MSGFRPYYTAFSDIWSLGVILVNMISGRNPWEKATLTDPCFVQYVENPDFLFDALAISEGVNEILRHIFLLNPLARLSLQQLRLAVLRLDTFFRTEDELSVVESYARAPAPQEQRAPAPAPAPAPSRPVTAVAPQSHRHAHAHASRPSAHSPAAQRPPGLSCLPSLGGEGRSTGSQSTAGSSGSVASSDENSMVITPENSAVGVVVRARNNEEEVEVEVEEEQARRVRVAGADRIRLRLEDADTNLKMKKEPAADAFLFPRLDMNMNVNARHAHDHS